MWSIWFYFTLYFSFSWNGSHHPILNTWLEMTLPNSLPSAWLRDLFWLILKIDFINWQVLDAGFVDLDDQQANHSKEFFGVRFQYYAFVMLVLVFSKQKQFVLSSARILVVCVQVSKQQLLNSIWSILKQCVYFTTCLEAYSGGWCPAQFWQDAIYWYLIWYMILYELAAIVNPKRFWYLLQCKVPKIF